MKIPYNWLREFVDLPEDPEETGHRLSLSGLECAGVHDALPAIDGLVVGEVLAVEPHPDADKLTVCRVDAGGGEPLRIVCGAPDVHAGMKAPVMLPGGKLPDGTEIRKTKLRGVESEGMLCSARELGLGDDHTGLLDLGPGVAVGAPVVDALGGNEAVLELEITPNRGDALSLLGVARDLSAILDTKLHVPGANAVPAEIDDAFPVELEAPDAGPVFAGRVIRGVDPTAATPLWMRERLRRAGIRPVNPVVDVTQYVMLELGQPMHAYDLARLKGSIRVRWARDGERVRLLDGSEQALDPDLLVIADDSAVLGLAGIMGGEESSVLYDGPGGHAATRAQEDADPDFPAATSDIFLESAFFQPAAIRERPRRLDLLTDAAYRFERGVDPSGQARAVERATRLILEIAGGRPGPTRITRSEDHLPRHGPVKLRKDRLARILGVEVPDEQVLRILAALGFATEAVEGGWRATAPAHRFDIDLEDDLIEEVGRIHGYHHIPALQYPATGDMPAAPEGIVPASRLREVLVQRGYQEVITYSFVGYALQRGLTGRVGPALANPVTADMTHMRASLWPGLVEAMRYNRNRQRDRIRIFESGLRFIMEDKDLKQEMMIAALTTGSLFPEQWGMDNASGDFHDLRGDLEALAAAGGGELSVEPGKLPTLHPGQSACLRLDGEEVGWMGKIHPGLAESLEIPQDTLLFEVLAEPFQRSRVPAYAPVSRYPAVRRDLAVVVPEAVPAADLRSAAAEAAGETLRNLVIFDVYQGQGLEKGTKSLAMGLIFQKLSSTLKDEEVDALVQGVVRRLETSCDARLRE